MVCVFARAERSRCQGERFLANGLSAFATRVRALRKKREMSLRELGEASGLDFTYLSKIENDAVSVPSSDALQRLRAALNPTTSEWAELVKAAEDLRERPLELKPQASPEEQVLLRRIYSGAVTREQVRRMLRISGPASRRASAKR